MKPPEKELFAGLLASRNPRAFTSYKCALYGLIPLAGLVLGPIAIGLGIAGWRAANLDSKREGMAQSRAAIVLGTLETITNGVGVALIVIGLASLNG